MTAEALLSRLEGVKQTAAGRWLAKCPAHADRRPSLSVREAEDGRVLVHCFGECGVDAVLAATGLEMADLFPPRPEFPAHGTRSGPRVPVAEVFRAVGDEVWVVVCAAADLTSGLLLSCDEHDRLRLAARRLSAAMEVVNGYR